MCVYEGAVYTKVGVTKEKGEERKDEDGERKEEGDVKKKKRAASEKRVKIKRDRGRENKKMAQFRWSKQQMWDRC